MYIINFKTKGYELTASGNIINSILNYKRKRLVSIFWLPKEQKQAKTAISRKKLSEKSVEGNKNDLFTKNFSMFKYFLTEIGFFFHQYNFKKSNMNKYIRATKFLRKLVVSTPLNS